ncbi:MAG: dockerin type I repeat-containing protein [Oscillospiraceae bacterium]|nr:dockerin type I repeat-containing protein [Oscillospiraceae bacterium]
MKKAVSIVLIMCVFLSAAVVSVYADEPPPPPQSYIIEIENGNKVFVMLARDDTFKGIEKSGLYYNFEPYEVIYTVDEHFYANEIYLSNDGLYFIHIPWWVGIGRYEPLPIAPAISFFANGEIIKSYEVSDLIKLSSGLISVSHIQWDYQRERTFYENNVFSVITRGGTTMFFDITTGEIVSGGNLTVTERHTARLVFPLRGLTTEHVLFILYYLAGHMEFSQATLTRYDVNGDGVVDTADALMILRFIAGLED